MKLEIRPEPTDAERAAIEAALQILDEGPERGAWWAAGLAENLEPADEDRDEDRR